MQVFFFRFLFFFTFSFFRLLFISKNVFSWTFICSRWPRFLYNLFSKTFKSYFHINVYIIYLKACNRVSIKGSIFRCNLQILLPRFRLALNMQDLYSQFLPSWGSVLKIPIFYRGRGLVRYSLIVQRLKNRRNHFRDNSYSKELRLIVFAFTICGLHGVKIYSVFPFSHRHETGRLVRFQDV